MYSDTLMSTYGIVFMATPHPSSGSKEKWGEMVAILKRIISVSGFKKSLQQMLCSELKTHSIEILETNKLFQLLTANIEIVTCFELQFAPGLDERVSVLLILPQILQFLTFRIRLWTGSPLLLARCMNYRSS